MSYCGSSTYQVRRQNAQDMIFYSFFQKHYPGVQGEALVVCEPCKIVNEMKNPHIVHMCIFLKFRFIAFYLIINGNFYKVKTI